MRFALAFPLLLCTACAAMEARQVQPESLRLDTTTLHLRLTDGTLCEVNWQAAPAGRLDGCGPGYGYAVEVEQSPNLARQLVEGLFLALGAEKALAPMAEVVITDPAGGDWVFTSPGPLER
ncbi:hypothetical protein [Xinfangfangia pollutisoli]|uniref:hypothetical protein n=1 Tax=Xinfangfangia pollutisoli TaxID=2865960 RepID=UPI001CD35657|nr:hypothetical protein [Xinfangfangia pollutisoli]